MEVWMGMYDLSSADTGHESRFFASESEASAFVANKNKPRVKKLDVPTDLEGLVAFLNDNFALS